MTATTPLARPGDTGSTSTRPAGSGARRSHGPVARYTIDIDTGGTFTDGFVADHDTGRVVHAKVPSTPHDPSQGLLDCVTYAAGRLGLTVRELLAGALVLRYSSTIATNAIIERRGLRVGILIDAGARERFGLGAGSPLVAAGFLRAGLVREIAAAASAAAVVEAFQDLVDHGAQTVLVAFSGGDGARERAAKAAIQERYPAHYLGAAPVFAAGEVVTGGSDRERLGTVFLAAYVHQHLARYLYRAEERLRREGLARPLLVVHADGGVSRIAKTHALDTYNSGPVSGIQGARALAERRGDRLAITVDMGGTSMDIGIIEDARLPQTVSWSLAGVDVRLPTPRVEAVGGAGGSIARVAGGAVVVGPDSAGASPGPACFGLGGTRPTVTDADLVLGYLDPDAFLGGRMRLDRHRAEAALEPIAAGLGTDVLGAAWAVKEAVDRQSAGEIARHAAAPGMIAGATLLLYGGAGPVHGAGILAHLGAARAVATRTASIFSAYSSATMDVTHRYPLQTAGDGADDIAEQVTAFLPVAARDMRGEGFAVGELGHRLVAVSGAADAREVSLPFSPGGQQAVAAQAAGAAGPGGYLALEVRAGVPHHVPTPEQLGSADPSAARRGERAAYWGPEPGLVATPVYEREALVPGHVVDGPAILQGADTTIVVPPGARLTVDEWGDDILTRAAAGEPGGRER